MKNQYQLYSLFLDGASLLIAVILTLIGIIGWYGFRGQKGISFFLYNTLLGYHYFYHALYYSGLLFKTPGLFLTAGITSVAGPTFFYYFYSFIFKENFEIRGKEYLHLLIPAVNAIAILYYIFSTTLEYRMTQLSAGISFLSPEDWPFGGYSQVLLGIILVFYLILGIKMALQELNFQFVQENFKSGHFPKQFHFVNLGIHVILLVCFLGWIFNPHNTLPYRIFTILIFLSFMGIYTLTLVYPYALQLGFLVEVGSQFTIKQYSKSRLKNVDVALLEKNLMKLMKEKKLYLDENINLGKIADKLEIHSLQLSEYLNVIKNQTFSEYLRKFRVNEAKKLVRSAESFNITRIAFDSGFNSVSSFYKAFRIETGMTPNAYRKKNLPPHDT